MGYGDRLCLMMGADVRLLRLLIMMILYCMLNNAKLRRVDMGMLLFIIQKTILSVIIINIPYSTLQMKEYYVLSFVMVVAVRCHLYTYQLEYISSTVATFILVVMNSAPLYLMTYAS